MVFELVDRIGQARKTWNCCVPKALDVRRLEIGLSGSLRAW